MLKLIILAVTATTCFAAVARQVRPCVFSDLKCIRDNLSANSKCNRRVQGSVPAEYTINSFEYKTPFFNSSYVDKGLIIRNHNKCTVSEFFFNVGTDVAVLTLDCPNLEFESDRTLIQHSTALEDSYFNYHIRGVYPLIRLTVNLPNANNLNLCTASVFADVTALPTFTIDPKDKSTANFLSRDLTVLNIYERETFAYRGPLLARYYINSLICNFGCNY